MEKEKQDLPKYIIYEKNEDLGLAYFDAETQTYVSNNRNYKVSKEEYVKNNDQREQ